MSKFLVYGLRDPITYEIRYVGKSCSGHNRPRQHFTKKVEIEAKTHKAKWVRSLLSKGMTPEVVVLETGFSNNKELIASEIKWIALGRDALGARFTNATLGGDGADSESARKRQVMLWTDSAYRERLTASIREFSTKPAHRAKLSIVFKRVYDDPIYRQKALALRRKESRDPIVLKRRKDGQKIAFSDPEYKKKRSELAKALWKDPYFRDRVLASKRVAVCTSEVRNNMRLAALKRHRPSMLINLMS